MRPLRVVPDVVTMLLFEWDEAKNIANVDKHGISFGEAAEIFSGFVVSDSDGRFNYGEIREISYGRIREAIVVAVVNTKRNGQIRIVSARRANRQERKRFETALLASLDG